MDYAKLHTRQVQATECANQIAWKAVVGVCGRQSSLNTGHCWIDILCIEKVSFSSEVTATQTVQHTCAGPSRPPLYVLTRYVRIAPTCLLFRLPHVFSFGTCPVYDKDYLLSCMGCDRKSCVSYADISVGRFAALYCCRMAVDLRFESRT